MTDAVTRLLFKQPNREAVGWYQGREVSTVGFHAQAEQLAHRLREWQGDVINLCEDRYHFLLVFVASSLLGKDNLLPHNRSRGTLEELVNRHPNSPCINDAEVLEWLRHPPNLAGCSPSCAPAKQTAAIVFTSGSTGVPTAHRKSLSSLIMGSNLLDRRLQLDYQLRPSALAATIPPQHMFGLESTVMLPAIHPYPIHAGRPFFPADVTATLAALPAPRALVTTPVHLRALMAEPQLDWPRLEFILCSTAPLTAELAAQAETATGAKLIEIYGSSETGAIATRRTAVESSWWPMATVKIRPTAAATYIEGAHLSATAEIGDIVQPTTGGRFNLLGRDADMIKIAGKRTSLAELTEKLLAIPGVIDGVVLQPAQEPDRVVRLAALVVAPELNSETIRASLLEVVDPVFVPRPILLVEALPRGGAGKPDRNKLLQLLHQLEEKL